MAAAVMRTFQMDRSDAVILMKIGMISVGMVARVITEREGNHLSIVADHAVMKDTGKIVDTQMVIGLEGIVEATACATGVVRNTVVAEAKEAVEVAISSPRADTAVKHRDANRRETQ